jgi:AraC-like DNA-binding protein
VETCTSLAEFLRAPVGRCVIGRSWLYFYPRIGLCGFAVWGRPTGDDMLDLSRVLAVELDQPPHVSLVDVHLMEGLEAAAFRTIEDYVREHYEALTRVVTKLALVRPPGLMGAVTAGFFGVQAPPYPVDVFDDAARALRWLGVDEGFRLELGAAVAEASGAPALLTRMRAWIVEHLAKPKIGDAAQALGTSERTLQRKLLEHGTTFQNEVNSTRVREAQRRLLDSDAQLTRIALDIGCGSLATFSSLFRKRIGETPSAWRAKMRSKA